MALAVMGLGSLPANAAEVPIVQSAYAEQTAINQTRFTLLFDAPVENLSKDDFEVTRGCTIAYLEIQDATAQVDLVDCPSGLVTLTLLANSVGSANLGPEANQSFQIEIDATRPSGSFSEIQVAGTGPFTYTTQLRFSEPVDLDATRLRFASSTACTTTVIKIDNGLELQAVCGYAELSWTLQANALLDAAGHSGPYRDIQVVMLNAAPPAPAPEVPKPQVPAPIEPPQQPAPQPVEPAVPGQAVLPTPDPTESPSASGSAAASSSEQLPQPTEPEIVVTITPAAGNDPIVSTATGETVLEVLAETAKPAERQELNLKTDLPASIAPQAQLAAAIDAGVNQDAGEPSTSIAIWMIGIGSLTLIFLGLARRFIGR